MQNLDTICDRILGKQRQVPPARSTLVGISGIDASGKGYLTAELAEELRRQGLHAAVLNVDGWLNLPSQRFNPVEPAQHFYEHALRLDEMFADLVLPLRDQRRVRICMEFVEETAIAFQRRTVEYADVDIVLLEGIFLFKRPYRAHFDLRLWIDCTFDTALQRAISRGQEALSPDETVRAYRTIYFPAQELHFQLDNPRACADAVIVNDPALHGRRACGAADRPLHTV